MEEASGKRDVVLGGVGTISVMFRGEARLAHFANAIALFGVHICGNPSLRVFVRTETQMRIEFVTHVVAVGGQIFRVMIKARRAHLLLGIAETKLRVLRDEHGHISARVRLLVFALAQFVR